MGWSGRVPNSSPVLRRFGRARFGVSPRRESGYTSLTAAHPTEAVIRRLTPQRAAVRAPGTRARLSLPRTRRSRPSRLLQPFRRLRAPRSSPECPRRREQPGRGVDDDVEADRRSSYRRLSSRNGFRYPEVSNIVTSVWPTVSAGRDGVRPPSITCANVGAANSSATASSSARDRGARRRPHRRRRRRRRDHGGAPRRARVAHARRSGR